MEINLFFVSLLIIVMTFRAYFMMISDKRKAIKGKWRTPEKRLFQVAFLLGSLGIWLGMLPPVNHKKSKTSFLLILTLITAVQIFVFVHVHYTYNDQFYFKIPF
jgi:uncharacterized membrane protein YsdA (DUF1294 family)